MKSTKDHFDYSSKSGRKTKEAMKWLKEFLGKHSHQANMCKYRAHEKGISMRTLARAKKYLGVIAFQKGRYWYWYVAE